MRRSSRPRSLLAFVLALAGSTASAQSVWIVDDDGPGDFATLQDAVDAAAPGDILRVRTDLPAQFNGSTPPPEVGRVVIDGKGLVIVGEGAVRPRVAYHLVVRNLPQDQDLVLRSVRLGYYRVHDQGSPHPPPSPPTCLLEENQGTIWVEDCSVEFIEGALRAVGGLVSQLHGISAVNCEDVILTRCVVAATPWNTAVNPPSGPVNRAALELVHSTVHAYESSFHGMTSGSNYWIDGGDGASVADSFLFAGGCAFTGGNDTKCFFCTLPQGHNGNGISVTGASEAHAVGCTFTPGSGTGLPGQPIVGSVDEHSAPARTYRIERAIHEGRRATLTATGPAGEMVFGLRSTLPQGSFQPLHGGSLLLAPPLETTFEGVIPASGILIRQLALPPNGPVEMQVRQGLFLTASSEAFLSSGSLLVAIPPGLYEEISSKLPR